MEFGRLAQLCFRRLPIALAGTLQHRCRHGLIGCRVLLLKVCTNAQLLVILDVHPIQLVVEVFVECRLSGHAPPEDVAERLAKHLCRTLVALHPLADEDRIQQRRAYLDVDGLLQPLHPAVLAVTVVGHHGVGLFTRQRLDSHRQSTRKFIDMIQRDGSPRVALSGLDGDVRPIKCGHKQLALHHTPMGLVAVSSTHVIQVSVHQLALLAPCATSSSCLCCSRCLRVRTHAAWTARGPAVD